MSAVPSNWVGPTAKVVLLFGAGASAFSGPVLYRGELNKSPPLGCGTNGLFAALVAEGGIAARFPSEVQAALIDDFEAGMRLLEHMPGTWHCAFQRQIALHLANYRIRPHNHYLDLLAPAHMRSRDVQYSTINYDMLLDQALGSYGLQIEGAPKDSPNPRFVTLLKLHGACNVLMKIQGDIHGNEVIVAPFGFHSPIGGNVGKLYLARSYREVERWCRDYANEQFAPVVAQYVREKTFVTHAEAFEGMQEFWATKVQGAKSVVLIGVRYVPGDEHIWKPLLESDAELLVVDPNFELIEAWGVSRARKPQHIARFFSDLPIIQEAVRSALSVPA
ncbi:MAG: hypothetical protein ABI156_11950 [Caldimonas sp.]